MLAGLCAWYMDCLRDAPLPTKCVTSACISLLGDGGAQFHEERTRAKKTGAQDVSLLHFDYSVRRGLTNFADSLLICAPMLHYGYGWLESVIPVLDHPSLPASSAAAAHVLVDDYVFDAVFIAIMFITTGIGEGYRPGQILSQFRKDYVPSVKTMWKAGFVLMPLEFCMFRYLPLSLRVLGMNLVEIVWDALVSFMIHKRRKEEAQEAAARRATAPKTAGGKGRKPKGGAREDERLKLPSDMYP